MLEAGGEVDLAQEPVGADGDGQLGAQGLDGDAAAVPPVLRQEDRGHATLAHETLDLVAIAERLAELFQHVRHYLPSVVGECCKINGGDGS